MADVSAHLATPMISVGRLTDGVIAGLAGGVMFGILMQLMDMIAMVAMLTGSESTAVGWVIHLAISAFIGATFAVLFGGRVTRLAPAAG